MANIIIKSDERREAEQYVASQFHLGDMSAEERDAVETINARANEAREIAHRNEGRIVR